MRANLLFLTLLAITLVPNVLGLHDGGPVTHSEKVTVAQNSLKTEVSIKSNTAWSGLIEMQARAGGCGLFSYIFPQKTCGGNPSDVHRYVILTAGDSQTFTLDTPIAAGTYCVSMVSTDTCCTQQSDCSSVSPYRWGSRLGTVVVPGNVPAPNPSPGASLPQPTEPPAGFVATKITSGSFFEAYGFLIGLALIILGIGWLALRRLI